MKCCQVLLLLLLAFSQAGLAAVTPPIVPWPSVGEQLQRDHVQPGSALERLIQSNQDFQLLRADEASDGLRIPPWLRVFWRKAHPEVAFSANDPSGGYPLILNEIYEWMLSHQDLVAGPLAPKAEFGKSVTLSSNLRISGLQTAPRSESDIRINFWNPSKVIAAANDIETSGRQAQFYSSDGGTTWGQTQLPLINGALFEGDPAVDWTSDGIAWATTLGIVDSMTNIQVQAFKSTNGGAIWVFDGVISSSQTTPDKEMLWADHGAASPFKDNLYVIWTKGPGIYVNRRTSGSWGTPVQIDAGSIFNGIAGTDVKTNSFGDVFAFWPGYDPVAFPTDARILVNKSTDGGQTFGSVVTVGRTFAKYQIRIPAQATRTVLIYASAAAYRTAAKNLVYASWTDLTGAPGCSITANAPQTNTASTCKTRIWLARSGDGGSTWSAPVMINNQPSLNDQFQQHLAVDETTGVVSLVYCDTVADSGRHKADVWYQSSYDEGVTWGAPVKVTTAQTDETSTGSDANQFGDYSGLSGYAGAFLPSWTDRRNNAREEIWTAYIQDVPTPPVTSTVSLWVSANGNDGNNCNYATPCRTFSGALSRVAPGGEIDVLDSGDFGPVTIDKSVSLVSAGPLGAIQAGTGNAVTINAGPNDKIVLRGLALDGLGTGSNGISFIAGGALYVENCTVNAFGQHGIDFAPTNGSGRLFVTDTLLRNNGVGAVGGGLRLLASTGPGFVASVDGLRAENNVVGLKAENLGTVTIRNSLAANNGYSGFSATNSSGSGAVRMLIEDSVSTHNGTSGVLANGLATVTLSNVAVTDNQFGLNFLTGGLILSFGNNKVQGNGTDGVPSQTLTNR
ncbi:MAG: right-handed parallel beta-helix repeat-containing protein [Thermoanaerobaculia bacterium]